MQSPPFERWLLLFSLVLGGGGIYLDDRFGCPMFDKTKRFMSIVYAVKMLGVINPSEWAIACAM